MKLNLICGIYCGKNEWHIAMTAYNVCHFVVRNYLFIVWDARNKRTKTKFHSTNCRFSFGWDSVVSKSDASVQHHCHYYIFIKTEMDRRVCCHLCRRLCVKFILIVCTQKHFLIRCCSSANQTCDEISISAQVNQQKQVKINAKR